MDIDLAERLFNFSVRIIKYTRNIKKTKDHEVIINQLLKSSTSVGANYEEGQSASSKADFKYKIDIALREIREANYWLRILNAVNGVDLELKTLLRESDELKKILGKISSKVSRIQ